MFQSLDVSHDFERAPRVCHPTLIFGLGGKGREIARGIYQGVRTFFGAECPHSALVEDDICEQTGRDSETGPVSPAIADHLVVHQVEGIDGRALVAAHGEDTSFPMWRVVDPTILATIPDTSHLGGYGGPQVARAAIEFNPEAVNDFYLRVGQAAERIRRRHDGWTCTGTLWVLSASSCAGAVGSNVLNVLEGMRPHLPRPFRVLHQSLLIADKGSVPNRLEAKALQHAFLTELRHRAKEPTCN